MLELPPLSLYIHIPWCVRKCPYCDFNSHVNSHLSKALPEQDYLQALKRDLESDLDFVQGRELKTIFIGGGTPSLMSGQFYTDLLQYIATRIPLKHDIEITLEANPGTTEAKRFEAYLKAGINRLSIGVQSFEDEHLKQLGRIHSGAEAAIAIGQAKRAGFSNFNLDLMHGLPGQSVDAAIHDLEQAISHQPTHMSWYQLTIEPNTEYFRRPPVLPEDDALWAIQVAGVKALQRHGFDQYEVSAFAQPDHQARHNLNYWEFGDYIGVGAGAHSKLTINDSKRILRYRKARMPNTYLLAKPDNRIGFEQIHQEDLGFEFLMNALRLNQGVAESMFVQRTGLDVKALEPQLGELRGRGLIVGKRLQTTEKGHLFLNSVLEKFARNGI